MGLEKRGRPHRPHCWHMALSLRLWGLCPDYALKFHNSRKWALLGSQKSPQTQLHFAKEQSSPEKPSHMSEATQRMSSSACVQALWGEVQGSPAQWGKLTLLPHLILSQSRVTRHASLPGTDELGTGDFPG